MAQSAEADRPGSEGLRVDKWLWAARFFKTRALAQDAVELGRVTLDGARIKPARTIRVGDRLKIQAGESHFEVWVRAVIDRRGPAPFARTLYEETPASLLARQTAQAQRALAREPAQFIEGGRPTKRDRRRLDRWQELP